MHATQPVADRYRTALMVAVLIPIGVMLGGCAESRLDVGPVRYDVVVRLNPESHELVGRTNLLAEVLDQTAIGSPNARAIELLLHSDLTVDSVEVTGATLVAPVVTVQPAADCAGGEPAVVRVMVSQPEPQVQLEVAYAGALHQDPSAGEKAGQVHNFEMSAHVGTDGVFLSEGGHWYPLLNLPDDAAPELALADYSLSSNEIDGFAMVAGLEQKGSTELHDLNWESRYPLSHIVLLGGPLKRWSRQHGRITLHAVVDPAKEAVAQDILDLSVEYLDKYEPLVGPYPFSEFTVLEAFFSSGFAFPTCTQIVGSQLTRYKQYHRHGYIDHELLHNYWGNGIYVDPRHGNWCEGLASFAGNYYGHLLDGDEEGARKQRRNWSNFLSAIQPEDDKPLATFGQKDGAGRGIGYSKGAAVLQMLEGKIGSDALFAGLRRMTAEFMGKFATWDDFQAAFEQESGKDLDRFFAQWVHGSGAPQLSLAAARLTPGADELAVEIDQGGTDFELEVPLRLFYAGRTDDLTVAIDRPVQTVSVPCRTEGLTAVELDPDYRLFRKLKPDEVMPTCSMTKRAEHLLIVVPDGDLPKPYQTVVNEFTKAVLGDTDDPEEGHEVTVRPTADLTPAELAGGSVLILGEAATHPTVQAFLKRTRCPVQWHESGFSVEADRYDDPGHAVFLTVHHPDQAGQGVTVYCGNSDAALANARVLSFYPNSLLVFETPTTAPPAQAHGKPMGMGMPRSEVVKRLDFEFHDRVEF